MKFLEKDLEEIIFETHQSNSNLLLDKGLITTGKMFRQLRIGSYGVADLVTFRREPSYFHDDNCLKIKVYELKKDKAGISAFLQAVRYCKGIQEYINNYRKKDINLSFEIVLCAKQIDTYSDFIYLTDFLDSSWFNYKLHLSCFSFKYDINGVKFTQEINYKLSNNGFNK